MNREYKFKKIVNFLKKDLEESESILGEIYDSMPNVIKITKDSFTIPITEDKAVEKINNYLRYEKEVVGGFDFELYDDDGNQLCKKVSWRNVSLPPANKDYEIFIYIFADGDEYNEYDGLPIDYFKENQKPIKESWNATYKAAEEFVNKCHNANVSRNAAKRILDQSWDDFENASPTFE